MSKIKNVILAAGVLMAVSSLSVQAATDATTTAPAAKPAAAKIDIHKDLANLHKAYAERAHDRHELAVALHTKNKVAAAKARADIKKDNAKIHRLTVDLHKDRAKLARHHVVKHPVAKK